MGFETKTTAEIRKEVCDHLSALQVPVKWVPSKSTYDNFGEEGEGRLTGEGQVAFAVGIPSSAAITRQTQKRALMLESVVGIRWLHRIPPGCQPEGYDEGLEIESAMIRHLGCPPVRCFLKFKSARREVVDGCMVGEALFTATHTLDLRKEP